MTTHFLYPGDIFTYPWSLTLWSSRDIMGTPIGDGINQNMTTVILVISHAADAYFVMAQDKIGWVYPDPTRARLLNKHDNGTTAT